ncbi:MAG: pantetheine-phosphate adenylyltransferase [Phycisphaerae bacterium]|nr:pantetheine-phosphate adenylyltransferase [Phycisphaerae bacterium]
MRPKRKKIAVFAGTFDPPTNGHLDIIRRARLLFDELIVAVGRNPEKAPCFSEAERVQMLRELTANMDNVRVMSYPGLTMDFVREHGATVIIKGIRDSSDLGSELQQANVNQIAGAVETVFLLSSDQHAMTSSALIRQIVEFGGGNPERLRRLVPPTVARRLRRLVRRNHGRGNGSRRRRARRSRVNGRRARRVARR